MYSKFMKGQSDPVLYVSIYGVVFNVHSFSMQSGILESLPKRAKICAPNAEDIGNFA